MTGTGLYPPIALSERGMLDAGEGHRIYWECSGNPLGKPVVVLHGGPGSGSNPVSRRHFDPGAYRIIQFDQRGSGRSTPSVTVDEGLAGNTLWHLVRDMELLRAHLGVTRWQLFGGSWGATVALAYAQQHPDRVSEIVLRGVFTARQAELDWLYRGGAGHLFPREWDEFLAPVPRAEQEDPLAAYHRLVFHADPAVRERAAVAWSAWEGAIVSIRPQRSYQQEYGRPEFALAFARVAAHYFAHRVWLAEGQLVERAGALAGIPGVLVQGRYDLVCPPNTAYALARNWPGCRLELLDEAGHAVGDPGVVAALRAATDRFAHG